MDGGRVEGIFVGPARTLPGPVGRVRAHAGKDERGIPLAADESRRNVLTRGVDVNALVGRRFRIGDVECEGVELCEPCTSLQKMTRPGVLKGMVHRAGLNADIL